MINIRIIISPAKTMKVDNDAFAHRQLPIFVEDTQRLLGYLKTLNYKELKSIWKCSDNLAKLNFNRVEKMDIQSNLTPSILAFEGLQYKYMGAGTFTYEQLDYIEKHLRILSGFYGILKPFDGIVPYRLEMKSKLLDWKYETLYDFWKAKIAKSLFSESNCIINLASKEYSDVISEHLPENGKIINCAFGELIDGKVIKKATLLKMARGEIVRFMAEKNIQKAEDIKKFNRLDYVYMEGFSDDSNYIFVKKDTLK